MRKRKTISPSIVPDIKVPETLLRSRKLFLFGAINPITVEPLIKNLIVLNIVNQDPIHLFINSSGGEIASGFALIDTFKILRCPIVTVIQGEALSMAAYISIAGTQRLMCPNSFWMIHDMKGGIDGDYSSKVECRAEYIKKLWKRQEDHLNRYTKLDSKDIQFARNGELWLTPEECLAKGVIDGFCGNEK